LLEKWRLEHPHDTPPSSRQAVTNFCALLPDCLDDYVTEDSAVRVVDVFIDELDLAALGFAGVVPEATGRPSYHPSTLLKIYLYGYLNQVQSSRRLEREAQRNIEVMWLTGKLAPDFKTIADFRRENGEAIRAVCRQFVLLCRGIGPATGTTPPGQSVCARTKWTPASRGIWRCSTPPIGRRTGWLSCGLPG
jgi:transposase